MKSRIFAGYISLAQAIIDQASNDVASADRISSSTNWRVVASDAEVFLNSDWCDYLQKMIYLWHHRNDKQCMDPIIS